MAGLPGFITTDNTVNTRFKAPVVSGAFQRDGGVGGPLPLGGGFVCIQSTSSVTNQVVTTADAVIGRASFVYIPVVNSGTLMAGAAPPYTGCGTPIVWNDNLKLLQVWSSGAASWMTQATGSSFAAGGAGFTTSQ